MTKITVALLLMICIYQELPAATYYLSTISGDDLRTNTQAQRSSTPWKTLSRLQAYLSNLKAGDSILFKRGETFEGRLFILKSGTTNSPIVFSTYGSGDKPIINGFSTITSWSSLGKNIYKASLDAGVYLNILTVNNLVMAMGRWPNISEPDKGYLTIDNNAKSQDGNGKYTGGSFQDAALQKSPDWTGAQAVIRKRHWVIDRCRITRHAGSTISYITPSHHDINNGWGYFIQNSAATLDKHGEWFYDPADHTVRLYSTLPPSRLAVKAGAVDTLVYINNQSFITFDNLVFQGADTVAMKIVNGSSNIKIRNCDFRYCGMRAIVANASKNIEVENCLFVNSNNESLLFNDCSYSTIRNNTIKNIHLWRGMGEDNDGGSAIALVHEKNSLVEFNNLDSLGATGIAFLGSFITVKNNLVKNFTLVKDDAAGIYTWAGGLPSDLMTNRKITGNIVLNGTGAPEGTDTKVAGSTNAFYVDDLGMNVELTGNTGANMSSSGLYLHNVQKTIVKDNTFYNNQSTQLLINHDANGFLDLDNNSTNGLETEYPTRNLEIKNNIFFAKTASQGILAIGSLSDDVAKAGSLDSNYYIHPFNYHSIISTDVHQNGTIHASYNLAGWKNKFGWDEHSRLSPVIIPQYKLNAVNSVNKVQNGSFDTKLSNIEAGGACTLQWDNNKLDGGAVKVTATDKNSPAELGANIDLYATTAGTTYRVTFSLVGSTEMQNLTAYVRRWGGISGKDYQIISEIRYFKLSKTRTECEFLFTAPTSDPGVKLSLISSGQMTPFWFDNVEVRTVQVAAVNAGDNILFEVNPSKTARTVLLTGNYKDIGGKVHTKSVVIKPYGSVILFKEIVKK